MANRKDSHSDIVHEDSDDDSEQELPSSKRIKKREDSAGLLGANLTDQHPLIAEKRVTFSSTRQNRNRNKNKANMERNLDLIPEPTHTKTTSAVTAKEPSTSSYALKNKSFLSYSNKVSEQKEEDEESSQKTKTPPPLNFESKNIIELCDQFDEIAEEESDRGTKKLEAKLSYSGLVFWFVVICITNVLVNVDHGCIPAATVTIKRDLELDNASLGILGAVVYWGLLAGSFTSPPIFLHFPVKSIILCCILFNMVCLVGFTLFVDFFILWGFRFGVGFFQVFLWIYFPVWIDIFGTDNNKTIWLTLLQSSVPLGVVTGYGITAIFDAEFGFWQLSYYLQTVVYFFLFIVFTWIPKQYIEDQRVDEDEEFQDVIASEPVNFKNKFDNEFEDDDGYMSASESEDDGYQGEFSSKADISSIALSYKKGLK
jgi:hypothetical protein